MSTTAVAPAKSAGRITKKFRMVPTAQGAKVLTEQTLPEGIKGKDLTRYAMLDKRIKRMSKEHGVLNKLIKAVFTDTGIFQFENVIIRRSTALSRTFDLEAAEKAYPREKYPDLYTQVWTLDKAALEAVAGKRIARFEVATPVPRLSVEVIDALVVEVEGE